MLARGLVRPDARAEAIVPSDLRSLQMSIVAKGPITDICRQAFVYRGAHFICWGAYATLMHPKKKLPTSSSSSSIVPISSRRVVSHRSRPVTVHVGPLLGPVRATSPDAVRNQMGQDPASYSPFIHRATGIQGPDVASYLFVATSGGNYL